LVANFNNWQCAPGKKLGQLEKNRRETGTVSLKKKKRSGGQKAVSKWGRSEMGARDQFELKGRNQKKQWGKDQVKRRQGSNRQPTTHPDPMRQT